MKFRKYKNRKIYSLDMSKYVTLTDLLSLARTGNEIQVLCNYTRNDITSQVLLQAAATASNYTSGQVMSFIRGT